jgi:hypothetical protein
MDIVDSIIMSGSAAAEAAAYIESRKESPSLKKESADVYA